MDLRLQLSCQAFAGVSVSEVGEKMDDEDFGLVAVAAETGVVMIVVRELHLEVWLCGIITQPC